MGKSEIAALPIQRENSLDICKSSTCNGTYNMSANEKTPRSKPENRLQIAIPEDMELLTNQVGGHTWGNNSVGMIKDKETILKPIMVRKYQCGEREIDFYEKMENCDDSQLAELKEFVPKYYGTKTVPINGDLLKCIVLEDITADFAEPCIIDIKIGRRTWDPEAVYDKIVKEEGKYQECKRDLSFCIPGLQVYRIQNNQFVKYDKDYGKNLNKETAPNALQLFLNGERGFCRSLLVQILAPLWRIQHWARNQRRIRLFASSILIAYDARRLKECLRYNGILKPKLKLTRSCSLYRPLSLAVLNNNMPDKVSTGFSGQLTTEGPILTPTFRKKYMDFPSRKNSNNVWQQSIHSLKRTHSFQNNYDKNVQNRRQDYTDMLEDLCCEHKSELWATVKMIDFARVYPAHKCDIDNNYLQGIENLVKILEEFLMDSE